MISNIKTLLKSIALVPVATVMFAGSAQAQLLGDTVNGQLAITNGSTVFNRNAEVTDPGVEFNFGNIIFLDLKDESFDIIHDLTSLGGDGVRPLTWSLSDFGPDYVITDVALASGNSSLINGISFTDDSIRVDIAGYFFDKEDRNNTWSFNVATANVAQSVPEPTTILGLFAVGGAAVVSRRKKQAAK